MRRPTLEQDIQDRITAVAKEGGTHYQQGRLHEALPFILKAWDLIPEPKLKWDYFGQSMSRTLVTTYIKIGEFNNAHTWLKVMREAYDALDIGSDPSADFIEAELNYRSGNLDTAYEIFDSLYKKYKKRPFQDESPDLWEFYQQRAKLKK